MLKISDSKEGPKSERTRENSRVLEERKREREMGRKG